LILGALGACVPRRDLQPGQIAGLTKLDEVMDVQSTVADPQFKKADQGTYADTDWAAFADTGSRIQATSKKILDFSKGPAFDQLATQLNEKAVALSAAAQAKDSALASKALHEMKATCKACHSKFK
jgi:cytochrome c556